MTNWKDLGIEGVEVGGIRVRKNLHLVLTNSEFLPGIGGKIQIVNLVPGHTVSSDDKYEFVSNLLPIADEDTKKHIKDIENGTWVEYKYIATKESGKLPAGIFKDHASRPNKGGDTI